MTLKRSENRNVKQESGTPKYTWKRDAKNTVVKVVFQLD